LVPHTRAIAAGGSAGCTRSRGLRASRTPNAHRWRYRSAVGDQPRRTFPLGLSALLGLTRANDDRNRSITKNAGGQVPSARRAAQSAEKFGGFKPCSETTTRWWRTIWISALRKHLRRYPGWLRLRDGRRAGRSAYWLRDQSDSRLTPISPGVAPRHFPVAFSCPRTNFVATDIAGNLPSCLALVPASHCTCTNEP
jgi:hypothetical protein